MGEVLIGREHGQVPAEAHGAEQKIYAPALHSLRAARIEAQRRLLVVTRVKREIVERSKPLAQLLELSLPSHPR